MNRGASSVQWICLAVAAAFLLGAGCSRTTTKTENLGPPVIETMPNPDSAFVPIEMDSLARVTFVPIYFEYNQYRLDANQIRTLKKIGDLLLARQSIQIVAEGHCDDRGSSDYNMALGDKRARSVKLWLTSYGIDETRIQTTSYGKESLVRLSCANDPCHAENRRVTFKLLAR